MLNTLKPIKDNKPDDNKNLSKYKEIFEELSNERMSERLDISEKIDFNNLTCYFISPNLAPINFTSFRGPWNIYSEIKNVNISIKKVEKDQNKFKSSLSRIQ